MVREDDLRGCSFEQFVRSAFDHPCPAEERGPNWWHTEPVDEVNLLTDAPRQLEHARTLFLDPLVLQTRFGLSVEQIDQGFWFLAIGDYAPDYQPFFSAPLWSEDVDLDLRRSCVAAMFDLYEKLFSSVRADSASSMWWDLLGTFTIEQRNNLPTLRPHPIPAQESVRREMVETLARILGLPAPHCQVAALHGLNHIATAEEREPLIDRYLASAAIDATLREYAHACCSGELP